MKKNIKKFIVAFALVAVLIAGYFILFQKPETAAADWWDDSWLYRQTVAITNTGTAQTDFQVMITLDSATLITANKMQSDCDDTRVTDINGKLIPHWIEPTTCNTSATKIWTKVPSISTSGDTVYLYYGNSAVTSTGNKTDTLLSWTQTTDDDFNGGVATDVVISSDSVEIDIKSVADGEWYVINDDLVVVGTATGYLMWPRQNSLGTNNNATKQWKIEDTVGAPSWNSSTYVYDYMAGSCVSACQKASYPAFSWAEDLDYQGYTDWRMPIASELQQLWYDGVTYISYINSYYWSADVRNSDTAFHVRFGNGLVYNDLKTTYRLLRAVRSGDSPYITSDSNLISSSNDTTTTSDFNNISWNGVTPAGTTIKYQIATNNDNAIWTFIGPDGTNATYYTTQEESIHSSHQGDRYIKYKAYLETTDITVTPTLNDITVFYTKYSATISVGSPTGEERGPGPVAFWQFDEGFGQTANDSTINANNGTLGATSGVEASDPTWQTEDMCISGKCLKFDGVDDYVDAGNWDAIQNITVGAWFKTNSSGTIQSIISHGGSWASLDIDWHLRIGETGTAQWYVYRYNAGTLIESTDTFNDGNWHYISGKISGTTGELYVDGLLKDTSSINAYVSGKTDTVQIGVRPGRDNYRFNGFIDSVKIYPYARTAAQIKADYASRGTVSGSSVVIASEAKQSLSDGLVGYWKMDEASWNGTAGEVVDSSGSGNDGVAVGATGIPTTGAGKFGNGGVFDGVDDYVEIQDDVILRQNLENSFTLGMWVYNNESGTGNIRTTLSMGGNYEIGIDNNDYYRIHYRDGDGGWRNEYGTSQAITVNQWEYIILTFDGSTMRFYKNGEYKSSRVDTVLFNYAADLRIGHQGSGNDYFNGSIDEVRIYNRALSPGEVRDLYNFAPGPVGWWKMDEKVSGNGQTINDSSGYGNTGTTSSANGTGMDCMVQGKYGSACEFDGVDDYVNVGNGSSLTMTNFTWEAWIKRNTDDASEDHIINRGLPRQFYVKGNKLYMQVSGAESQIGLTTILPYTWYHCVFLYDGITWKIFLNGNLEGSNTWDYTTPTGNLNIGRYNGGLAYFPGSIDDVRIYNYARTPSQIMEDYSAGAGRKQPIGHWKFDEGYGVTANNSGIGGTALNGTLTNMASPATSTSGWTDEGKMGKGLVFDGVDDYVTVADNNGLDFDGAKKFTSAFWFKSSSTTRQFFISKYAGGGNPGYYIDYYDFSNVFRLVIYDDVNTTPIEISGGDSSYMNGEWHHLVVVFDGAASSNSAMYIDGVLKNSNQINQPGDFSNAQPLYIGDYVVSSFPVNGSIDDVKIYNYALTEDEVREEYNQGALLKLGSTGTDSSGNPDDSQSREYCIPGDTSTCNPPVGRWDFNEGAGSTVNDISGNNNIGTWSGTGSHWTQGKIGKGGSFNGSDDYVGITDNDIINPANVTISAWIKYTYRAADAPHRIVSKWWDGTNRSYDFSVANNLAFQISDDGGSPAGNPSADFTPYHDIWTFVTGTYDGTTQKIYINGIEKADSTAESGDIFKNNADLIIGTQPRNASPTTVFENYLDGSIDQVRIYDYARTPAQIAWDYNRGKPVAHWKFDECQGGTAYDASGNGNDGTITIGATGTQDGIGTCTDGDTSNAWYNGRSGKYNSGMSFDGSDDYVEATVSQTKTAYALWVKNGSVWEHVVNNDGTEYVNGVLGTPTSYPLYVSGTTVQVGKSDAAVFVDCDVDNVKIFNYALTAEQIKTEYNGGAVRFE